MIEMKNFIDGEFVGSGSGTTFENLDPTVGRVYAQVHEASRDDVDRAVKAAQAPMRGPWGRISG